MQGDTRKIQDAFLIDDTLTDLLKKLAEFAQPVTTKIGIQIGAVALTDIYLVIEQTIGDIHDDSTR